MTNLTRKNCIMKMYDYLTEDAVDMLGEYNLTLFRSYLKQHGYRVASTVGEFTSWKAMRQQTACEEAVMWLSNGGDLCNTMRTDNSTRRFGRAIGYHEVMVAISNLVVKEDRQWKAYARTEEDREALIEWLNSNGTAYVRKASGCFTNVSYVSGRPYLFIPSFVYMQNNAVTRGELLSEKEIKLLRSYPWKLEVSTAYQQQAVIDWLTRVFPEYPRDQLLPSSILETLYCINGKPEWKIANNPHVPRLNVQFVTETSIRCINIGPLIDKRNQELAELKEQLASIQAQIAELE